MGGMEQFSGPKEGKTSPEKLKMQVKDLMDATHDIAASGKIEGSNFSTQDLRSIIKLGRDLLTKMLEKNGLKELSGNVEKALSSAESASWTTSALDSSDPFFEQINKEISTGYDAIGEGTGETAEIIFDLFDRLLVLQSIYNKSTQKTVEPEKYEKEEAGRRVEWEANKAEMAEIVKKSRDNEGEVVGDKLTLAGANDVGNMYRNLLAQVKKYGLEKQKISVTIDDGEHLNEYEVVFNGESINVSKFQYGADKVLEDVKGYTFDVECMGVLPDPDSRKPYNEEEPIGEFDSTLIDEKSKEKIGYVHVALGSSDHDSYLWQDNALTYKNVLEKVAQVVAIKIDEIEAKKRDF